MSKKILQYPERMPSGFFDRSSKMWFHSVSEVARNMRADEIEQHMLFFAAGAPVSEYNPLIAATGMISAGGLGFFGVDKAGTPYVVGGYTPDDNNPGCWKSWMAGTDDGWKNHWRDITRATRWVMDRLMEGGARRLETNCVASRTDAQAWYTDFLGMRLDGELRRYCANGESLRIYSFTQDDWAERMGADNLSEGGDGQQ